MRHCAESHKVAGSIPDGIIEVFNLIYPSGLTMSLGLSELLIEMRTMKVSWRGKGGRYRSLTT